MPDYQKTAVEYYLKNYYPQYPPDIWNSSGTVSVNEAGEYHIDLSTQSRGFPDISANGAVSLCS